MRRGKGMRAVYIARQRRFRVGGQQFPLSAPWGGGPKALKAGGLTIGGRGVICNTNYNVGPWVTTWLQRNVLLPSF